MSRAAFHRAAPHSTEPRGTLLSYAALRWTTPLQMSLAPLHWAPASHPAEPRGTLTEPSRTLPFPPFVSNSYKGCMLFAMWHFWQKLTKKIERFSGHRWGWGGGRGWTSRWSWGHVSGEHTDLRLLRQGSAWGTRGSRWVLYSQKVCYIFYIFLLWIKNH